MTAAAHDDPYPTGIGAGQSRLATLLSIDDVAAYLRVSPRWVYEQVRTGRLPAMLIARSWRIRPDAVEEFAESFRVDADGCV
jgi:excisionase family DNA binding protein